MEKLATLFEKGINSRGIDFSPRRLQQQNVCNGTEIIKIEPLFENYVVLVSPLLKEQFTQK